MKCLIFLLFQTCLVFGQPLSKFTHFTPERQHILSEMGKFFDQTIRKNFPSEIDSSSYRHFFECLVHQPKPDALFVLDIDRNKLNEINKILFKDHNYYFFYMRQLEHSESNLPTKDYQDSVPTIRYSSNIKHHSCLRGVYLNCDGYVRTINSPNPVIREMQHLMQTAGDIGLFMFALNILNGNLSEISEPTVKEMGAVLFWGHLCFCGGIDLKIRKGFCEKCPK